MESEQPLVHVVAESENPWERIRQFWVRAYSVEVAFVIGVALFSWGCYSIYNWLKTKLRGYRREARQNKLLKDRQEQAKKEEAAVERHWPRPTVASESQVSNGGVEEEEVIVPVMMHSRKCTPSCDRKSCKSKLKELTSKLSALSHHRHESTRFEAGSLWIFRTQLDLGPETAIKLSGIAAEPWCSNITVQLGRWRACCLIDGEVKTTNLDNDEVPAILYSSFKPGELKVEGLNLRRVSIQMVSNNGRSWTLVSPVDVGLGEEALSSPGQHPISTEATFDEGVGNFGTWTCKLPHMLDFLEDQSIAAFSVIAFKHILKDKVTVRVSSLPVQIQGELLRTVLRDILPAIFFGLYAMYFLVHLMRTISATSMLVILIIIIIIFQILPDSAETAIGLWWMELGLSMTSTAQSIETEIESYFSKLSEKGTTKTELTDEDYVAAPGSHSIHNSQWEWPVYDTIYPLNGPPHLARCKDSAGGKLEKEIVPFLVVKLNINDLPWADQIEVKVKSTFLQSLLRGEMDGWKCEKVVTIYRPELFHRYDDLSSRCRRPSSVEKLEPLEPSSSEDLSAGCNEEELLHLTHFVRFMDEELEDIKSRYAAMEKERCVEWDMMWAFFPPKAKVVYIEARTDECVCGEVLRTKHHSTPQGLQLVIEVSKWDYNCETWSEYSTSVTVPIFEGNRAFHSLQIRPLQIEDEPDATLNSFLNRGNEFCKLSMKQRSCYMDYRGSMISCITVDGCLRVVKENADGRVMIDLGSFSKMNPDYPLGSAQPPCEVIRDNKVKTIDMVGDRSLIYAPPYVYGFSFRVKKWGSFSVAGFSEIDFNDSAYDDLVMDPTRKKLIRTLVQERRKKGMGRERQDNDKVDPIAFKGQGCIFLCYGPPGTGKTLTAESLSEKLRCPLWCLSVSELGVTPAALETMLVKISDVVASWGAILLLDEADVYLERRSSKDLVRNAMTGVFLRQLEYYRGVLFLTTNRESEFDEAICSRITLLLNYEKHDKDQRIILWTNLFRRAGVEDFTDKNIAELSKPDFNGREITKVMKTAQTLAKSEKQKLVTEHVRAALAVHAGSSKIRTLSKPSKGASLHGHQHPSKQEESSISEDQGKLAASLPRREMNGTRSDLPYPPSPASAGSSRPAAGSSPPAADSSPPAADSSPPAADSSPSAPSSSLPAAGSCPPEAVPDPVPCSPRSPNPPDPARTRPNSKLVPTVHGPSQVVQPVREGELAPRGHRGARPLLAGRARGRPVARR